MSLPMALLLPGSTWTDVTPPAIANSYASSWVLSPSTLLNQGNIGPFGELTSVAPTYRVSLIKLYPNRIPYLQ